MLSAERLVLSCFTNVRSSKTSVVSYGVCVRPRRRQRLSALAGKGRRQARVSAKTQRHHTLPLPSETGAYFSESSVARPPRQRVESEIGG